MCGRYYVDTETVGEMERLVRRVDEKLKRENLFGEKKMRDIYPTDFAAVILAEKEGLGAVPQKWGFPGFSGSKVIFNARSESVLEKRMFRDSVLKRRLVIPAAGFYEWNSAKEKVAFYQKQQRILYMAGFYNRFDEEERFVILTTSANASVRDTHERMPLLLEPEEIQDWLREDGLVRHFLEKEPGLLQSCREASAP